MRRGFPPYGGITFEEHRGQATAPGGTAPLLPRSWRGPYLPLGTMDTFATYHAPADFNETANTMACPVRQAGTAQFDRGTDPHTQSNPLPMCHRPGCWSLTVA